MFFYINPSNQQNQQRQWKIIITKENQGRGEARASKVTPFCDV